MDASPPDSEPVEQLIRSAQAGDAGAVEELLSTNLKMLRAFIHKRLGAKLRARETTQDLAQSVCREVLQDLDRFEYRGVGSFESWLMTRAENKIRNRANYWHRGQRDLDREQRGGHADMERLSSFATPSRHMTTKERLEELESVFRRLPADYQEVILLARVDGFSHAIVAERMGRTMFSMQKLLYRALGQLAAGLQQDPL